MKMSAPDWSVKVSSHETTGDTHDDSDWNARSIGREADHGSREPGKRADLIALSDDVCACAEEKIAGITPTLTMVGGAVVAGAPAAG